ncbi:TPA: hypothetical protein ACRNYZ_006561, partial [Pseudomonas aeruginosa]
SVVKGRDGNERNRLFPGCADRLLEMSVSFEQDAFRSETREQYPLTAVVTPVNTAKDGEY